MPDLRVLYLQGNPVVKDIRHYRKIIIGRCKELRYLDDRPVFDDERRRVKAWYEAYISSNGNADIAQEAERNELTLLRKEREEADERNRLAFEELVRKGEEVKRQRALESERTGQVSIYGATGINGEFNPYSMESIIPVPENPELKDLREQRLQDILSKGNNTSENNENNIPNSDVHTNANANVNVQENNTNNTIDSTTSTEITQQQEQHQDDESEKDVKWTKFKIMEASDDEQESNEEIVQDKHQKEEQQDSSEIQVDDIDFTLSLQDDNGVMEGNEGTSTDLYELD